MANFIDYLRNVIVSSRLLEERREVLQSSRVQ